MLVTLKVGRLSPDVPETSNGAPGLVVPIPTFPATNKDVPEFAGSK